MLSETDKEELSRSDRHWAIGFTLLGAAGVLWLFIAFTNPPPSHVPNRANTTSRPASR